MQYVLDQAEYDQLMQSSQASKKLLKELPSVEKLQTFCTMIADTVEVKEGWAKGNTWGCILTVKSEHYCDCCPAKEVCPYPHKEWSK